LEWNENVCAMLYTYVCVFGNQFVVYNKVAFTFMSCGQATEDGLIDVCVCVCGMAAVGHMHVVLHQRSLFTVSNGLVEQFLICGNIFILCVCVCV